MSIPGDSNLTVRQARFAELYHRYGNGTRAYGEAGNIAKTDEGNYPSWVTVEAHRLLRNPNVKEEINRLIGDAQALASMTVDELLDFHATVVRTPVGEVGPDSPFCEEYEVKPDGTVKVKMISKVASSREIARLTGMDSPQKVEISAENEFLGMLAALTQSKND
jgi:hypothetical protein